jgi:hypothetical protein
MSRTWLALGAVLLVACNKGGADSGKSAEIPADCDDYISALSDCYADGGFELADGGIDAETWCVEFEEAGGDDSLFDCYVDLIADADCTSSEGISTMSASLAICEQVEE